MVMTVRFGNLVSDANEVSIRTEAIPNNTRASTDSDDVKAMFLHSSLSNRTFNMTFGSK